MESNGVTQVLWRRVSPEKLAWARWNDDYVVYHRSSGQTHFLNTASAILLTDVLATPLDVGAAGRELATIQSPGSAPVAGQQLLSVMLRLEQLGLVERVRA